MYMIRSQPGVIKRDKEETGTDYNSNQAYWLCKRTKMGIESKGFFFYLRPRWCMFLYRVILKKNLIFMQLNSDYNSVRVCTTVIM